MLADFRYSPFEYWFNYRAIEPFLYAKIRSPVSDSTSSPCQYQSNPQLLRLFLDSHIGYHSRDSQFENHRLLQLSINTDAMLADSKRSPFEHWLNHQLLRRSLYSNILSPDDFNIK